MCAGRATHRQLAAKRGAQGVMDRKGILQLSQACKPNGSDKVSANKRHQYTRCAWDAPREQWTAELAMVQGAGSTRERLRGKGCCGVAGHAAMEKRLTAHAHMHKRCGPTQTSHRARALAHVLWANKKRIGLQSDSASQHHASKNIQLPS